MIEQNHVTDASPGEINRTEHRLWQVRKGRMRRKSVARFLGPYQGRTAKSLILSLHSTEVLLLVSSIRAEKFAVSFWGKKTR